MRLSEICVPCPHNFCPLHTNQYFLSTIYPHTVLVLSLLSLPVVSCRPCTPRNLLTFGPCVALTQHSKHSLSPPSLGVTLTTCAVHRPHPAPLSPLPLAVMLATSSSHQNGRVSHCKQYFFFKSALVLTLPAWAHTQKGIKIKHLCSDRGGEYTGNAFTKFLGEQGTER